MPSLGSPAVSFSAEVNQSIGAELYQDHFFRPVNQLPAAMSPADITLITRRKIPLNLEKFRPLVPAEIMMLAARLSSKLETKSRPNTDQLQLRRNDEGSSRRDDCDDQSWVGCNDCNDGKLFRLAKQHCLRDSGVCQTLRRFLAI